MAFAVVPPWLPGNVAFSSFTLQQTPATPEPLPPSAPIVPVDRPRHVGTVVVADAINDGVIVAREIPSVAIVDQAIAIVVDIIASDLSGVLSDVRRQIEVSVYVALVNDADVHISTVCFPGRPRR